MNISISTDNDQLDIGMIHTYLSENSYWASSRSRTEVELSIKYSICFGMYLGDKHQIGFARVVTDRIIFAYLMDIFVLDAYQNRGFGKKLIEFILHHEIIDKLKTVALKTKDAHGFYEKYGFEKIGNSPLWMAKDNQDIG